MRVGIGRREGFGESIGREAISAQEIGFFGVAGDAIDVAGDVSRSESLGFGFASVLGGVSVNVCSLDDGDVAEGVSTALDVDFAVWFVG